MPADADVRACILRLVHARGLHKTVCPSEVARALVDDGPKHPAAWRSLMPQVRAVAASLAAEGLLQVSQRGEPVNAQMAKGAIRFGMQFTN